MDAQHRVEVVSAFYEQCVWVRSIRTHFADLFEQNKRRRELLSESANTFFGDLNRLLIDYIILQKCKLTDPAFSGQGDAHSNLTSNYILQLDWSAQTKFILDAENKRLMSFRKKILPSRHKLVSHLDLKAHLQMQPIGLGRFSSDEESEFWDALQVFVSAAHEAAIGGPCDINASMPCGDVNSLIHCLKDGADYEDIVNNENGFLSSRINKRRFDDA